MKRWVDDPDERELGALMAPLAAERMVDPAAKAQVWQVVQRRTQRSAAGMWRRAGVGVVVVAVVIAGVAVGRELMKEEPPAPVPVPVPAPVPVVVVAPAPVVVVQQPTEAITPISPPVARRARPLEPKVVVADAELAAYREARAAMRADLAAGLEKMTAFVGAYAGGRFDAEARLSIIECKARLGRLGESEADVEAFLEKHAENERAGEVKFIRAEIQRQVHRRCDRALADYRAAADSPRVGDDARFFRGWCADAIGDVAERDAALRAYLAAAPEGRHAAAATALLGK